MSGARAQPGIAAPTLQMGNVSSLAPRSSPPDQHWDKPASAARLKPDFLDGLLHTSIRKVIFENYLETGRHFKIILGR